jgi:hypothetical protein
MTPARPQLLSFWMCVALVVGNSIGSGGSARKGSVALGIVGILATAILSGLSSAPGRSPVAWGAVLPGLGAPLYFWFTRSSR